MKYKKLYIYIFLCLGEGYSKLFEDIWAKRIAGSAFESVHEPINPEIFDGIFVGSSLIKLT